MNVDLSRRVSRTLDYLGYGASQRQFRQLIYSYQDQEMSRCIKGFTSVTVGSKGEGLTNLRESDRDILLIYKNVICMERHCQPPVVPRQTTVLACNMDLCYYGHTFLEVVQLGRSSIYRLCSFPKGFKYFLSSSALTEILLNFARKKELDNPVHKAHGIIGPALAYSSNGADFDIVPAIPCYCPSLLQAWNNRPRYNNWPSPELRQEVVRLEAVVAPTCSHQSIHSDLEWRICFNAGETALICSLKDMLLKLYVLLKAVKKDVLKPQKKEITSYVLKNIVFWLAELYPEELFTEDTLVDWLLFALEFLKQAVKHAELPYYMIPERNLLAGKMNPPQRDTMLTRLDDALFRGPSILLQCGRLGRILTTVNPIRVLVLGEKRNELEKLVLIMHTRALELRLSSMSEKDQDKLKVQDEIYRMANRRCLDIVVPEWELLTLLRVDVRFVFGKRVESLLV